MMALAMGKVVAASGMHPRCVVPRCVQARPINHSEHVTALVRARRQFKQHAASMHARPTVVSSLVEAIVIASVTTSAAMEHAHRKRPPVAPARDRISAQRGSVQMVFVATKPATVSVSSA